jgi:hypothetical protein
MACDPIYGPGRQGIVGFICSRGKRPGSRTPCCACGKVGAPKLCDGRTDRPGKTCDAPLCGRCASPIGRDRDLCPWCVNRARSATRPAPASKDGE